MSVSGTSGKDIAETGNAGASAVDGHPGAIAADPFDYFPTVASKIRPLGGTDYRPELSYGFHTQYFTCAPGHCTFFVEIDDLKATQGLLYLQVHMLSTEAGSHAAIATSARLSLAELAAGDGHASVTFESLRGMTYGIYGRIPEETDASASAVRIYLDRPANEVEGETADLSETRFGRQATVRSFYLNSSLRGSLSEPVSQVCTAAQFNDPAFREWAGRLGPDAGRDLATWNRAFILQSFSYYGMVAAGARALGWGDFEGGVAAWLASRSCNVTLIDDAPEDGDMDGWREQRRARLGSSSASGSIEIQPADMRAPGAELGQFDLLWSDMHARPPETAEAAARFVTDALNRLRLGGLAVHILPLSLTEGYSSPAVLARRDIERLALNLVSNRHTVAQLRFERGVGYSPSGGDDGTTSFGLLVRRGA